MRYSTYHKKLYNTKGQHHAIHPNHNLNEILRYHFMMRKGVAKSPQGKPPHGASHPPPAEMKYTWGAADLVQDFATRWRARGEHLNKQ